jgi:hypothetical protein
MSKKRKSDRHAPLQPPHRAPLIGGMTVMAFFDLPQHALCDARYWQVVNHLATMTTRK